MIVDGRNIAKEILAHAKVRAGHLSHPPRVLAFVANETPATKSYLSIKAKRAADAGCMLEVQQFPESVTTKELRSAIVKSDADAIIVQLPLPEEVETKIVCDSIPMEKDADVLSSAAREKFERGESGALLPPVVEAMREIFALYDVEPRGKKAAVIGKGWLVGNPAAIWLRQKGADVSVLTSKSGDLSAALRAADIVVSGAGSPHLITPDMLKEGVVFIDAGTSESGGEVVGDADPSCAAKCSLFTPVPGGVGPIAVACLFENAVILAERSVNN